MKTKLTFGIAGIMAFLFVLAPNAAPKGRVPGAALTLNATCSGNGDRADQCTVTATGLAGNTSYIFFVTDTCGGIYQTNITADASGNFSQQYNMPGEDINCITAGWTFTLSTGGKRSQIVATTSAGDPT
ncbi:MAG TPA: hypothetical protein VGR73_20555 [Bryobacteraceae bacterium]|nr:hypothetical protein [Bryobacteraceae bacterium]